MDGGFGLGQVPARLVPTATTTAVCGYCSTGCGLDVHLKDGVAVNVSAAADYPVNRGMACPKGWEALAPLTTSRRATRCLLRRSDGRLAPVGWREALDAFVTRFKDIQAAHGPASVAFLGTGQIVTEELALLGVLAKLGMGLKHGDGNTRQCMATAVAAYKECFGFDAPPYTYEDLEESDVLVFWGANPCIAHPILWSRVAASKRQREVVAIDPRRTQTAMAADQHLPIRPKHDLDLAYGLARELAARGAVDERFVAEHTSGFEAFVQHVQPYTLERVSRETGLPEASIRRLADSIEAGKRVSFWWTMGVNQSHQGTRTAQAIIALALMTGQIGRPGTGPNSITGQCNAMGSRLFSNTTSLLGGHRFDDPAARKKVAASLGVSSELIPTDPGWAYDRIVEGIARGEIRGLWVVATNPAHSWINQSDLQGLLDRLDFLVVQDMYADTETATRADLVLPAAGWGEKSGTFINSERRIGLVKQVARAPGEALSDFRIFKLIAEAWGCADVVSAFETPEATFDVLCQLTAGQPCDISGLGGYEELEALGGVQWPLPAGVEASQVATHRRLFEEGRFFTADQRARFVFEEARPMPEVASPRYPFTLLTGRGSSGQWHTQTRTGCSGVLRQLQAARPYVELNPDDARRLDIAPEELVRIVSRRGRMQARVFVTPTVQPGQVFVAMHDAATNQLTFPSFDPVSRQPAYKGCAVAIERLEAWAR